MRMIITETDIDQILVGRFFIEIDNNDNPYPLHPSKFNDFKPIEVRMEFWAEKRIHQVVFNDKEGLVSCPCLYGSIWRTQTKADFVESWNGKGDSTRYRRLLTSSELELVFDWFRKKQF
jgi:hypothetical protein